MNLKYITTVLAALLLISTATAENDMGIVSTDDLQAQINAAGAHWIAGETPVSAYRYAGVIIDDNMTRMDAQSAPEGYVSHPAYFNWHDLGGEDWMTPVRSQGSCGSCWAFGVVGAVEAMVNIDNNNPNLDLDLSEQHLVADCCKNCGSCSGGYPTAALQHIQTSGIPNETCYPYKARNGACMPCDDWDVNTIENFIRITPTQNAYKYALQNHGAMVVILEVPEDWYYYSAGIYEPITNVGRANHCVVLTGWNDSDGCWIIKNSYGENWGEDGYARVKYGNLEKYSYCYAIINTSTPSPPDLTLSILDVDGAGDTIRTSIAVSGDVVVSGLISAIQYNSSVLNLTRVTANTSIPSANIWTWGGLAQMLFVSAPQTNTNLIELEFEILQPIQPCKTTIRILPDSTSVVDADFNFIDDVVFKDGTITIRVSGDLTRDGVVDVRDVARCNSIQYGVTEPTAHDLIAGDLNGNGEIDENDMVAISNMVFGG